eukprot:scaffold20802_cov115-Isochrysis_galbana.AAC.4
MASFVRLPLQIQNGPEGRRGSPRSVGGVGGAKYGGGHAGGGGVRQLPGNAHPPLAHHPRAPVPIRCHHKERVAVVGRYEQTRPDCRPTERIVAWLPQGRAAAKRVAKDAPPPAGTRTRRIHQRASLRHNLAAGDDSVVAGRERLGQLGRGYDESGGCKRLADVRHVKGGAQEPVGEDERVARPRRVRGGAIACDPG